MYFLQKSLAIICAISLSPVVWSAGLEITQNGTKEMAHGYAGTATLLEDASVIAHNPAGLMRLEGVQVSIGASVLHAKIDYDARFISERVELENGVAPRVISGSGYGQNNMITPIPHLYYSKRINNDASFGIGLYVPFGSTTEFPSDWAGRYHAENSSQTAININPAFAFNLSDKISIGFGLIAQIYQANLTNQIDVGYLVSEATIDTIKTKSYSESSEKILINAVLDRFASQEKYQVYNEVVLSSVTYGFNFGTLWQPFDNIRLGLNYRSAISHIAKGEAKRITLDLPSFKSDFIADIELASGLSTVEATEALQKAFDERGAMGGDLISHVNLPQQLTLSAHWDITPSLAIMGNMTWTDWSVFEEIRLEYVDSSDRGGSDITNSGDDVRRRDLVQKLNFEDSIRYGVGVRYQLWPSLVLRGGYSIDNSPAQNADYRTPRGPDADRTIIGAGLSYQWSKSLEIDLAYSSITIAKAAVNARENPAGTQHRAEGHSQGEISSVSAQLNYKF